MSKLKAFLKPTKTEITDEISISERFLGEDGKPEKITIKSITQEENDKLIKLSTKTKREKSQLVETFDKQQYQARLVVACTANPDFADSELCEAYGVVNPLDLPGRMFLSGEYAKLVNAIMDINGFKDTEELDEESKNS